MTRGSQILHENHEETARQEQEARELARRSSAAQLMGALIQPKRYVGEVFTVGFNEFTVQVHDHFRREVQGIPQGAFLIATCIDPECSELDPDGEGTEIVLLRVTEPRTLPREGEREDQRTEAIERAMRDERPWEDQVDKYTRNKLSYSGLTCRVLGTVYLEPDPDHPEQLRKRLGTDIDNFYSGRGMKVYKPSGKALAALVNYSDPDVKSDHPLGGRLVNIAAIRYASTRRSQGSDAVDVTITPADLIGQKTALFGMTRSGKSNTTKVIAQAIYELRRDAVPLNPSDTPEQAERRARSNRIGQLIFDPQGEYANENVQDGGADNPNALKNIYTHFPDLTRESELATYGLKPHPRDPHRKLLKINFYGEPLHAAQLRQLESASHGQSEANLDAATAAFHTNIHTLLLGKQLFDEALAGSDSHYIRNFLAADLSLPDFSTFPDQEAYGQAVRYNRNLLVYRALLHGGGLRAPFAPDITNLFNAQLRATLRTPPAEGTGTRRNARSDRDASLQNEFSTAADLLEQAQVSWDDVITICKALAKLIGRPEFDEFDATYRRGHNGRSWADATFRNLIGMFAWSNGPKLAARVRENHEAGLTEDYAETIYQDLLNGKMVIIDQSLGGAGPNQVVANKIIEKILQSHVEVFGMGESPHPILVYVEEAHNLLPKRSADGEVNIWARLAKEGAKLNLGLVYATQEVSALQSNILKNTSNWFIAHLNNTEEVREVSKYYDFEDFAESIQRAPNRGFIRMRTRTNVFTIPVQVRKFDLSTSALPASSVPVHNGND